MSIIHDFKSLRRKVERMDQKAEFEEKNPPVPASFWEQFLGYPAGSFRGVHMGTPLFEIE
jgi:hypothetical protein